MERGTKRTGPAVEIRAENSSSLQGDGRRLRPVARDETGAADREYECPVCGNTTGTQSGVYLHLQVDHRKSELARALLDSDE